ncbi:MAG: TonB-dependent receptor [Burkholderiaceae bacterium]
MSPGTAGHRRAAAFLHALGFGLGLGLASGAVAQNGVPAPEPAASAPAPAQLQPVEVRGARPTDLQQRRESTAAKIVIGREEIERYGDDNVGDVLKRLPGVTMQGRAGRGGNIRMRGLGSGYTQILLDGERLPRGFSLDSLAPDQIERIEILRAPTAETGARAIAGTINIVTREGYVKRINDLRLSAGFENGRVQPQASWTRNDVVGAAIYNFTLSAFARDRESGSSTTTTRRSLADDSLVFEQRDTGEVRDTRRGLHASGRLQWRGDAGGPSLTLMPLLIHSTGSSRRSGTLTQLAGTTPPLYDTSATAGDSSFSLARLNGQWRQPLDGGGRIESSFGLSQHRSDDASVRFETTGGTLTRTLEDERRTRDRKLNASAKLTRLLSGEHSLVAGVEAETNRRTEQRHLQQDGVPLLSDFGDELKASATRFAAFAQDEWNLSPQWAAHAGLRWEGITTHGGGATDTPEASNRSSVWTPLLHAVWKPSPDSRDQVRFSLTRSYRSPSLPDLIARPQLDSRYPAAGPNPPTDPDRAGNPALRPELATGVDIAVERYLSGGGLLSANLFRRNISDYIRSRTALEVVSWSPVPRYVSRPQNVGDAVTQGLELEAKLRLDSVLVGAPKVDLRANASVFRSRVDAVPGPDNRIDQQPDWTANLGADYRVPGWPLTLGGNLNWTPAYPTRISETQTALQGRKTVADAYALWVVGPALQLRLTASNLAPRDHVTGTSVDDLGAPVPTRETALTRAPTYLNLQLRLEIKL